MHYQDWDETYRRARSVMKKNLPTVLTDLVRVEMSPCIEPGTFLIISQENWDYLNRGLLAAGVSGYDPEVIPYRLPQA